RIPTLRSLGLVLLVSRISGKGSEFRTFARTPGSCYPLSKDREQNPLSAILGRRFRVPDLSVSEAHSLCGSIIATGPPVGAGGPFRRHSPDKIIIVRAECIQHVSR